MAGLPVPEHMRNARLVTFEGIDGAGKSTLVAGVEAKLTARKADVVFTREETTSWLGEAVRRSIRDGADPLVTLYLFLADRAAHIAQLAPEFEAARLVLSDRYHDSTRAYQAVTLAERFGGAGRFDAWLDAQTRDWLVVPRRTYLVDLDAEAAVARMGGRDITTRYEKQDFLGRVRDEYLRIAKADAERFVVLDGREAPDVLVRRVLEDLEDQRLLVG